jgi:hypothetical protein
MCQKSGTFSKLDQASKLITLVRRVDVVCRLLYQSGLAKRLLVLWNVDAFEAGFGDHLRGGTRFCLVPRFRLMTYELRAYVKSLLINDTAPRRK